MKSYCKGQQTTPKPTCTKPFTANFLTKIDAHNRQMAKAKTVPALPRAPSPAHRREPAGPARATPYPLCSGLAHLGPPTRPRRSFHEQHLFISLILRL